MYKTPKLFLNVHGFGLVCAHLFETSSCVSSSSDERGKTRSTWFGGHVGTIVTFYGEPKTHRI